MKKAHSIYCSIIVLISLLSFSGCSKESDPASSGSTNTVLFSTPGSMAFKSSQQDFTASGIFDTTMTKGQAGGAFQFKEGNVNLVVVMSYKIVSDTSYSVAYVGIIDTLNPVATGEYPIWLPSGSRSAMFGYIPSFNPKKQVPDTYILMSGVVNVTSMSATAIQGTVNGSGINLLDTTKSITVTDGTFSVPVVQYKPFNLKLNPGVPEPEMPADAMKNAVRNIIKKNVY
ncbi:MAG: hypothetical protein ACOYNS_06330 [Bacteroidota bacterium]